MINLKYTGLPNFAIWPALKKRGRGFCAEVTVCGEDWCDLWTQGDDLVATSSELIYSGELMKVSMHGWHQDRFFFLFDHLMVYLKKVCRGSFTRTHARTDALSHFISPSSSSPPSLPSPLFIRTLVAVW